MKPNPMFYRLLLAGLLLISLAACQPAGQMLAPAGAPLPLPLTGSSASRLGAAALTFQRHGGGDNFAIIPVSAKTGQAVADAAPIEVGSMPAYRFSADRGQLAFLSNAAAECAAYCLRVLDLRTWKEAIRPIPLAEAFGAWFVIPGYRAVSTQIPVILNQQTETASEVKLIDLVQGKVVHTQALPANVIDATVTPDGHLAIYGTQTAADGKSSHVYVALLDPADLHPLWEQTIPDVQFITEWSGDHTDPTQGKYYNPAGAFTQDGTHLFLAAADRPLLVTVDFTKRGLHSAEIRPPTGLLDRLMAMTAGVVYAKTFNGVNKTGVLAPDGRYFYVVGEETSAVKGENGDYTMARKPLGLQVIDTQDGTLVRTVTTGANGLALTLDGQSLVLTGWDEVPGGNSHPWTDVVNLTTWQVTRRLQGTVSPSRLLDGSLVWLVTQQNNDNGYQIDLYQPGASTPQMQLRGPGTNWVDWLQIP